MYAYFFQNWAALMLASYGILINWVMFSKNITETNILRPV